MNERTHAPHEWSAGEATALRQAIRLTIERFAAALGVAPRTVANWAQRPDMTPRLDVQEALDELLRRCSPQVKERFEELTGRVTTLPGRISREELDALTSAVAVLSERMERLEQQLEHITRRPRHSTRHRSVVRSWL